MRIFRKIISVIFNPLGALYFPKTSDNIIKKTNRYPYIIYGIAFIATIIIILIVYRDVIFK